MEKRIVITHCPLETNKDEVFKMAKEDKDLEDTIKEQSRIHSLKGIETFERVHNIIVTEDGYYCAFYEDDLNHV